MLAYLVFKRISIYYLLILCLYILISCAHYSYIYLYPPVKHDHSEWDGRKIVFSEISKSLQQYFDDWIYRSGSFYKNVIYEEVVGDTGLVGGIIVDKTGDEYWKIKMASGEVYFHEKDFYDLKWGFIDHTYFLDDFDKAKQMMNKYIWLFQVKEKTYGDDRLFVFRNIYDDNANQLTKFTKFQKVKVIDVVPFVYGNTYTGSPFYLQIQSDTGEIGFVRHHSTYYGFQKRYIHFFEEDPFSPDWSDEIVGLIKEGKIRIGMSKNQVKLSWGTPDDINVTVTSRYRHEQWVYEFSSRYYVYFDDGILTSYQKY